MIGQMHGGVAVAVAACSDPWRASRGASITHCAGSIERSCTIQYHKPDLSQAPPIPAAQLAHAQATPFSMRI